MDQDKRRRLKRKGLIALGIFLLLVVLTATELLVQQVGSPGDIKENLKLFLILNINIIISLGLIATVFRHLVKLYLERKQKVLGSKFKSKLILFFVILALIPTSLLFIVSNNLINSTVDNWFNSQNEEALKKSLQIAQTYYDNSLGRAFNAVEKAAQSIGEKQLLGRPDYRALNSILLAAQKEGRLGALKVVNHLRTEVFSLPGPANYQGCFVSDNTDLVLKGLAGESFSIVRDSATDAPGELIDGAVPVFSAGERRSVQGVIIFNYYAPQGMIDMVEEIKQSYEDYKKRKIYKLPLKSIYSLIVLVTTLMVILAAVWLAFHLARGITVPFLRLAEGTREVAAGNLDYQVAVKGDDEINILVNSFNQMTADLKQNKAELEQTYRELERRKNYIETILDNIATGVLSCDSQGRLSTLNRSAAQMLHLHRNKIGSHFKEIFQVPEMSPLLGFITRGLARTQYKWRSELTLHQEEETVTLLASAVSLKGEDGSFQGLVVVFDDITQLIKAQKMAAWQEVARRIAHEIKNPLTPIQLSTQRLRRKFNQRAPDYEQVFDECTRTIIREVEAMKRMVNEFSRFARLPSTTLKPSLLNDVIRQTTSLYSSMPDGLQVIAELDENLPKLMLDSEQIKQMLVNLIDNAIHASAPGQQIRIKTSYEPQLRIARIDITDEGHGIAPRDKEKLFLPYFSTKKGGTGLGLSIVNRIVTEHNGYIRMENNHPRGTRFVVELPVV